MLPIRELGPAIRDTPADRVRGRGGWRTVCVCECVRVCGWVGGRVGGVGWGEVGWGGATG